MLNYALISIPVQPLTYNMYHMGYMGRYSGSYSQIYANMRWNRVSEVNSGGSEVKPEPRVGAHPTYDSYMYPF